jgi:hypothetical protein
LGWNIAAEPKAIKGGSATLNGKKGVAKTTPKAFGWLGHGYARSITQFAANLGL